MIRMLVSIFVVFMIISTANALEIKRLTLYSNSKVDSLPNTIKSQSIFESTDGYLIHGVKQYLDKNIFELSESFKFKEFHRFKLVVEYENDETDTIHISPFEQIVLKGKVYKFSKEFFRLLIYHMPYCRAVVYLKQLDY